MEGDLDVSDKCDTCGKPVVMLELSEIISESPPIYRCWPCSINAIIGEAGDKREHCPTCHGTGRVTAEPYTAQVNCPECDKDEWDSHKDEIKDKIDRWHRDDLIKELNSMADDAAQIAKELDDIDGQTTEGDEK